MVRNKQKCGVPAGSNYQQFQRDEECEDNSFLLGGSFDISFAACAFASLGSGVAVFPASCFSDGTINDSISSSNILKTEKFNSRYSNF